MPAQPQLFHKPHPPEAHPARGSVRPASTLTTPAKTAPLWLQRISLFILVLFCVYLGVLVTVLPWWTRVWDQNMLILSHPRLAEIGAVAGLHHERLDGSGYPRGVGGEAIPVTARLVAAADVYHALGEDRPHRPAVGAERAARVLREDVRSGRLDGESVNAVLAAAGHRVRRRPALPAGLTPREVEVLVLLARGASNKAIARRLSVSARTIGSHVEHVYTKIGVSSRGAAAVFALRHGLASGINTDRTGDDPAGADPTEGEPTEGETWDRNIG